MRKIRQTMLLGSAIMAVGFAATPALAADAEAPAPAATVSDNGVVNVGAGNNGDGQSDAAAPAPAPAPREWMPLDGSRFGAELGEKWIPVPNGSSGAPRQGWLATADGFFTREAHLAYDYTDGGTGQPNSSEVLARFNYPWTRRFWTGIEVPFYQRNGQQDGFGDITLSTLVMLAESRNLSINAGVGWRLPTGASRIGNGVFAAQPQVNFWTDVGAGFSLRGRVGYEFANKGRPDDFVLNFAVGQTVTPHKRAPFGDLTWYAAVNWREPVRGIGNSFVSIAPGVRTHLGGNLFLLGAVEFPLTPTRESFTRRYIVQLVQGF